MLSEWTETPSGIAAQIQGHARCFPLISLLLGLFCTIVSRFAHIFDHNPTSKIRPVANPLDRILRLSFCCC